MDENFVPNESESERVEVGLKFGQAIILIYGHCPLHPP